MLQGQVKNLTQNKFLYTYTDMIILGNFQYLRFFKYYHHNVELMFIWFHLSSPYNRNKFFFVYEKRELLNLFNSLIM